MTAPILRPYATGDAAEVLALNQSHLDGVGPLDPQRQEWLVSMADECLVVEDAGAVVGFVVTFGPDTDYDSRNYRWFCERYARFGYLDRVVVADSHQRRGLGRMMYDAVEPAVLGDGGHGRMALEVYVEPPNVGSLAFHAARGYTEVGRLPQDNGKVVTMLVKESRPRPAGRPSGP
jgi:predicted GNAT superfamily acetyltransferase